MRLNTIPHDGDMIEATFSEPEFIHYESPAMVTIAMKDNDIASIVVMNKDGTQHVMCSGKGECTISTLKDGTARQSPRMTLGYSR